MKITKKWCWTVVGILGLVVLYFATRLINLTALPIFTDEAIYIRWSQIGARDANWRFISLTDGKQPMFTWIMMVLLRVFDGFDPLYIGRFTSVLSGLAALFGVVCVTHELFRSKKYAFAAGFLYIIMPFTLWYDRMALYDAMVVSFSIWSLYFAVRLVKSFRLDMALLLGLILGGGMLNKTSGFLSLYLLPATLILFDWKKKNRMFRLVRWFILVLISAAVSQVAYSVLRLSPFFHIVGQKNNVFVFTLSEWMPQPFRFLAGNLRGMFDWLRQYMTLPVFLAAFLPVFIRLPKTRERLLLYAWWLIPFVGLANFAKILYPRFILFMSIPLLMIAAQSAVFVVSSIKKPLVRAGIIGILVLPSLYISFIAVRSPKEAPIPLSDRYQYIDDWPAGDGISEVVTYLAAQAKLKQVHIITEGTFGLLPYALEIYLVDMPNVVITGIWPLPDDVPAVIYEAMKEEKDVYLVLNESQVAPENWPLVRIGEYQKGRRIDRKLRLYRIGTMLARGMD